MSWLRRLFGMNVGGGEQTPEPGSLYEKHGLTVEFYPNSNFYVVRTRHYTTGSDWCYLNTDTGGILKPTLLVYAQKFQSEEAAWRYADKFIEQQYKENVIVKRR